MKYFRVATINTPEVLFDLENGCISMIGKSSTENSVEFYQTFISELIQFRNEKQDIHFEMGLEFFNTSSAKCLLDIFRELRKRAIKGNRVTINWFYEHIDKDMLEMGKDFAEITELEFTFLPQGELVF